MSDKLRFIIGTADKIISVEQLAEADKKNRGNKTEGFQGQKTGECRRNLCQKRSTFY